MRCMGFMDLLRMCCKALWLFVRDILRKFLHKIGVPGQPFCDRQVFLRTIPRINLLLEIIRRCALDCNAIRTTWTWGLKRCCYSRVHAWSWLNPHLQVDLTKSRLQWINRLYDIMCSWELKVFRRLNCGILCIPTSRSKNMWHKIMFVFWVPKESLWSICTLWLYISIPPEIRSIMTTFQASTRQSLQVAPSHPVYKRQHISTEHHT